MDHDKMRLARTIGIVGINSGIGDWDWGGVVLIFVEVSLKLFDGLVKREEGEGDGCDG